MFLEMQLYLEVSTRRPVNFSWLLCSLLIFAVKHFTKKKIVIASCKFQFCVVKHLKFRLVRLVVS